MVSQVIFGQHHFKSLSPTTKEEVKELLADTQETLDIKKPDSELTAKDLILSGIKHTFIKVI